MDDIALELEATKGLLYHYFRSKEELLRAVLQEHPLRLGIDTLEQALPAGDLRQAISDVALLSMREMSEHRAFIRFLVLQAQYSQEQHELVFRELIDRWTHIFESIIETHQKDGGEASARYLATQLVDVLLSAFLRGELGGRSKWQDLEAYVLDAVETIACRVEAVSGKKRQELRGQKGRV